MESTGQSPEARAFRLNITIKAETKARLDEARNKRGADINVSQVCDSAITAALERAEKPGVADLVERLRVESDRRRGIPYRLGHAEGMSWAHTRASWAEICAMAALDESDVVFGLTTWTGATEDEGPWSAEALDFVGRFRAPKADYKRNTPRRFGAPAYQTETGDWTRDEHLCDQYWRGWLAGVKDVFELVRPEIEPIGPAVGDTDPDDIPF